MLPVPRGIISFVSAGGTLAIYLVGLGPLTGPFPAPAGYPLQARLPVQVQLGEPGP